MPYEIEVLFDGACPICTREMRWLRRNDKAGKILFTDIAQPGFDPSSYGLTAESVMARIHARLANGKTIDGVEVFRRLYSIIGFKRLTAVSRLPGIAQVADLAYTLFAKNRMRLTGRCESGVCDVRAG